MLTVTITEFLGDNFVMIYELAGLVILLLVGAHISSKMKRKTLVAIILLFAELFCYVAERWTQTTVSSVRSSRLRFIRSIR